MAVGEVSEKGTSDNKTKLGEEMPFIFAGHHSACAQAGGIIDTLKTTKQKGEKPQSLQGDH